MPSRCLPFFSRSWCFALCGLFLLILWPLRPVVAAELRIAVAANFLSTLQQLAEQYHQQQDDRLLISAGSSGGLYAQIQHDAPFDLFLSADRQRPQALEQQGLILSGSRFTYARGLLALWSADPALVDASGAVLHQQAFSYLVLANPDNAPYGAAARQLLQQQGLWQRLSDQQRLIRSGNVRQALFQIRSGAAELGFIALAQARHPQLAGKGSLWIPDPDSYSPILQQGVILARSQQPEAARRFVRWLQSATAQKLIAGAGYQAVHGPRVADRIADRAAPLRPTRHLPPLLPVSAIRTQPAVTGGSGAAQ